MGAVGGLRGGGQIWSWSARSGQNAKFGFHCISMPLFPDFGQNAKKCRKCQKSVKFYGFSLSRTRGIASLPPLPVPIWLSHVTPAVPRDPPITHWPILHVYIQNPPDLCALIGNYELPCTEVAQINDLCEWQIVEERMYKRISFDCRRSERLKTPVYEYVKYTQENGWAVANPRFITRAQSSGFPLATSWR